MKALPWIIAVVLAGIVGFLIPRQTSSPTEIPLEQVYSKVSSAIVSVRTDIADLSDPELQGLGSAFHIGNGVYITAAHVVEGGTKVYIDTRARTVKHLEGVQQAKILGVVKALDLAVLQGETIATQVTWASTIPAIGSRCMAIGNPFARAPRTLTVGVISGLARVQQTPNGALAGLVQFDAQVNPGNSGGALLNGNGEVLGIVSSILSGTGSSAGVGFAISTTQARAVVEAIVRGEKPVLPSLGASSQDDSAVLQTTLPGGIAESAGLQAGDEILEIAGLPVESLIEASAVVSASAKGAKLSLQAKRNGKIRSFELLIP